MNKFIQFIIFFVIPIVVGIWAMYLFFGPIRPGKFDVGLGYFFLALGLSYAGKKMFDGRFLALSILLAGIAMVHTIMFWSGFITSPNKFIDGIGHLLFGLILFLSYHKKLASITAA